MNAFRMWVPQTLQAQWRFVRELKRGGQSRPVVLESLADGTRAVLKLLDPLTDEARARLKREVEILSGIDHPNIVKLLAHDVEAEPPWYLTKLGEPLDDYWSVQRRLLTPTELFDEARDAVSAMLHGLREFHVRGGVHRDVKPANVIIFPSATGKSPVLIDFGIAYLPADSRITPADGRIVANRFVAPPRALYSRMDDPPPWWDCMGVAWLWGWLLMDGREPKHGHYDARYHPFIADPRCERVRSMWMAVSVEETSPKNADEMLRLMESIGLGAGQNEQSLDAARFREALHAEHEARAQELGRSATFQATLTATAAVLGRFYEELLARVIEESEIAVAQGLPITWQRPDAIVEALRSISPRNSTSVFRAELGRNAIGRVVLEIRARLVPSRRPGFRPLQFRIEASKPPGRLLYSQVYYHAVHGGIGWVQPDEDEDYPESDANADYVERKVLDCLRGPELWSWTSGE